MNDCSIIVPTFKEAENISALVDRIAGVMPNEFTENDYELILVDDDSQDGLEDLVARLKMRYPWLQLIVRKQNPGLSQAILTGLCFAKFSQIVIMDADLSHPPEKIPEMLSMLNKPNVDLVIGSRYISGGSTDEVWPLYRRFISKAAAHLAYLLIPQTVQDPLSGFLAFKKAQCINSLNILNPIGWKISLEIIVKCQMKNIREIPIHFAARQQGFSKLNLGVAFQYFLHLQRLLMYKLFSRSYR